MLDQVDGVMVGREAYQNPYILAGVDNLLYGDIKEKVSRQEIVQTLIPYIQEQLRLGLRLNNVSRHILGLFHGEPGARGWRRYISENVSKAGADETVILRALEYTL